MSFPTSSKHIGEVEVYIHSLLTSALDGQLHTPANSPPGRKKPGSHGIGGCVGRRAGMEKLQVARSFKTCRESNPDSPACSQVTTLYRLLSSVLWYSKQVHHCSLFNLLKPTSYVMHHQFNTQQLYALPTLYLCVLYLSENKQRLVPLTA
jgi:hypothetical protein